MQSGCILKEVSFPVGIVFEGNKSLLKCTFCNKIAHFDGFHPQYNFIVKLQCQKCVSCSWHVCIKCPGVRSCWLGDNAVRNIRRHVRGQHEESFTLQMSSSIPEESGLDFDLPPVDEPIDVDCEKPVQLNQPASVQFAASPTTSDFLNDVVQHDLEKALDNLVTKSVMQNDYTPSCSVSKADRDMYLHLTQLSLSLGNKGHSHLVETLRLLGDKYQVH